MKKRTKKAKLSRPFRKSNPHHQYEILKAALPANLTPDQYQAACRRIADELGI